MGVLDLAAGLERFHAQAAGIALYIEAFRADQAIWLGVMGALGYPRNKRAFRMLATRVPWSMVAACGSSQELESLLLQAAGLGTRPAGTHSTPTRISSLSGSPPGMGAAVGAAANSQAVRIGGDIGPCADMG